MWVLILTVLTSSAPAVTTHDFSSQKACLTASADAAKAIEERSLEAGTEATVRGVCVKK